MQKRLTILLASLFFTFTISAQDLSYGLNAGFNYYSYFSKTPNGNTKLAETSMGTNLQYHLGLYLEVPLDKHFGFVGNVTYQNRSVDFPTSTHFYYVDINPVIKYDLDGNYGRDFYLTAGPRYSILLAAVRFANQNEVTEKFKPGNFGVLLGIGSEITDIFAAELLFDYGITNFSEQIESHWAGVQFRIVINVDELMAS